METIDQFFLKGITYTNLKVDCESNKLINEVVNVVKPIKDKVNSHKIVIPKIVACQSRHSMTLIELQKAISQLEKTVKERFERDDKRITKLEQNLILTDDELAGVKSMIFCQNKEDSSRLAS